MLISQRDIWNCYERAKRLGKKRGGGRGGGGGGRVTETLHTRETCETIPRIDTHKLTSHCRLGTLVFFTQHL